MALLEGYLGDSVGRLIIGVLRCKAIALRGIGVISGILHSEGQKYVFCHIVGKSLAGDDLNDTCHNVEREAVIIIVTRLELKRLICHSATDIDRRRSALGCGYCLLY